MKLKQIEDWLFIDRSGLLLSVQRHLVGEKSTNQIGLNKSLLRVRGRELVLKELSDAIEFEKTIGAVTANFVEFVRDLAVEQSFPVSMRQDFKVSVRLNHLVDICPSIESARSFNLYWIAKRPQKMIKFNLILKMLDEMNVAIEDKWKLIAIEHQRIMAQNLLNEAHQKVIALCKELTGLLDVPEYPAKPDCIEYLS